MDTAPQVISSPLGGRKDLMKKDSELVTVYETGNVAIVAIVKSLLDDGNIQYCVQGEHLQNLSAVGSIGFGYNVVVGPIQIQVDKSDVNLATELLKNVQESAA